MSIVSVSTLKEYLPEIQGSSVDADLTSTTEINLTKTTTDKQNGRVILNDDSPDSFDVGYRANKIVASFGFNTSNPPHDLVHALCVYCSHLQRAKNSQGNESITQRNSTVSLSPRTMPTEVKEILRGYRNVSTIL
jgi:hypothetical protein